MIPSNETYLKVGSFLIKDPLEGAIDFFVEFNSAENPFGFFLPSTDNFFNKNNVFSFISDAFLQKSNEPDFFQIFKKDYYHLTKPEEICEIIISTMYKHQQCRSNNTYISNDELQINWLKFKKESFSLTSSESCYQFFNFYNKENYKNYIQFVNNLQNRIKYYNSNFNIPNHLPMLLLSELIMKNLNKTFFINIVSLNYDGLDYYNKKSFDGYYDNLLHEYNLGLSTHLEFQKNTGEFKILLHWPWCLNKMLDSNFEKKISEETLIKINLKEILRYSQNFVNYKLNIKNYCYKNFENLFETFIPLLPFNYKYNTLEIDETLEINKNNFYHINTNFENIKIHEIKYKLSETFSKLNQKINFSKNYLQYCVYFHDLKYDAPENIYEKDFFIILPFWEIPRLQSLFVEKFLIDEERGYWDNQCEYRNEEAEIEYENQYNDEYDNDDILTNGKELWKEHVKDMMDWDSNWRENFDDFTDDMSNDY